MSAALAKNTSPAHQRNRQTLKYRIEQDYARPDDDSRRGESHRPELHRAGIDDRPTAPPYGRVLVSGRVRQSADAAAETARADRVGRQPAGRGAGHWRARRSRA